MLTLSNNPKQEIGTAQNQMSIAASNSPLAAVTSSVATGPETDLDQLIAETLTTSDDQKHEPTLIDTSETQLSIAAG